MAKIIGIIGSRRRNSWTDLNLTDQAFHVLYDTDPEISIVSGGCPKGGDKFAEIIAGRLAFKLILPSTPYPEEGGVIKIHPALWHLHGKSAGFKRNSNIAMDSTDLIACVSSDRSGGTEHTIKLFQKFHPEGKVILV